jgi:hypothetical protein
VVWLQRKIFGKSCDWHLPGLIAALQGGPSKPSLRISAGIACNDLVSELKWIAEGGGALGLPAAPAPPRFAAWRYVVAGAVGIALISAAALYVHVAAKSPSLPTVSLDFVLPEKLPMRSIDIPTRSPDGERIVFSAMNADNKYALWIRSLNSPDIRQLSGTEDAILPFWSPDGRQIGFLADGKLKRLDLAGGAPQTIAGVANNYLLKVLKLDIYRDPSKSNKYSCAVLAF